MPRYAREDLDRIRDATDFQALVEQRVELRRAGTGRMTGLCPFHDERTPSFSVNVDEKLFHCFGCGEGGDLFKYVELIEGVDFNGSVDLLADRAGIQLKTEEEDPETAARRARDRRLLELLDRTNRFFERQLWDGAEGAPARAELRRRGLDPEMLREFRVGYAPSGWDKVLVGSRHAGYRPEELLAAGVVQRSRDSDRLYDRFRRRITFPLADRRGRILGFGARAIGEDQKPKYINSSDGAVYHKGRHVFAAHQARRQAARTGEVILCEGYTDVIALHQAGLTNAVGLMGTALTPEQVQALGKLAPAVILALDADRAGRAAMLRAAELATAGGLKIRVVLMPDGMDPQDLLVKRGPEAIVRAFAEPMALGRFQVAHVLDQADLGSAEGKDRAIEDLRPVFARQPPGVLRMELMTEAAGRLRLDPAAFQAFVENAPLTGGAGASASSGGAARVDRAERRPTSGARPARPSGPASRPSVPQASGASSVPHDAADPVARLELSFLAESWAAGPEAADLLDDARIATQMRGAAHRAAATALRDALRSGAATPAARDDSARLVLDVVLRMAQAVEHPSCAAAELRGLELELGLVNEALRTGRTAAGASPNDLVMRKLELGKRIDLGVAEIWKGPRRTA